MSSVDCATWPPAATSTAPPTWSTGRDRGSSESPDDLAARLAIDRLPLRRRPGHRRLPRPARWAGRCCSRVSPGTGKTALAEALAEALDLPLVRLQCYEGIDAVAGALRLGLPPPDPAPARRRGGAGRSASADARGGRAGPVRRAVPARPAGAARAAREPGGAADRRDRPRRRRVRGVPARGALDLPGDDPRARHGRGPAPRRSSCSPPTAPARCTTRSSGAASTTGSTTPALEREVAIVRSRAPEVSADARPAGRRAGPAAARAPTWSSRPASPRPSTGPGAGPARRAARSTSRSAARTLGVGGEVPRGRRPGPGRPRPDAGRMSRVTATAAGTILRLLLGFTRALRAAGVAVTADRAAHLPAGGRRARPRRPAGDLLGRAGHAVRRARRTSRPTTRCSGRGSCDDGSTVTGERRQPVRCRCSRRRWPTTTPAASCRPSEAECVRCGRGQRPRGAAPPRHRHRSTRPSGPGWPRCSPRLPAPRRPSARRTAAGPRARGSVDAARDAAPHPRASWASRSSSRHRHRAPRQRRVVLLVDVSGSMSDVRRLAAAARPPAVVRGMPTRCSASAPGSPG